MGKVKIENLIQEGEGYLVEFKESIKSLDKEICAFANASGGSIYVGITDSGKIKKTVLTNKIKSQIQSIVRTLEPAPMIHIHPFDRVIAIHVEESPNKPVKSPHGFYLRIGSNSQKLTRDEIFSFAIKETKIRFDHQLYVKDSAPNLLNIRQVELFRQKAKLDADLDNLQLLENLGCMKKQNNIPYLTFAGVMLFGEEPQKVFPQATITLLHMKDLSTIIDQKIIKGSLFEQVEKTFQFIIERLKKKIEIISLIRKETLEIPEYVIRELVVNAVIHRDYFETASDIVIKVFDTYIEFTNPGRLADAIPLKSLFGKSYRRNPLLADIFFHAGYIERAGTGLLRVQKALQERDLPPLQLSQEGVFFIATLPRRSEMLQDSELNERQQEFLRMSEDFFPFSSKNYAKHFDISDRMARVDIKKLVDKKMIVKVRKNKQTKYDRKIGNSH